MKILIINRHELTWTTGHCGAHIPVPPDRRYLITRTFGGGLGDYDAKAFPNVMVIDMTKAARVEAAARWMIETYRIDAVVALHEKDMILAATLRQDYGLVGLDVATTYRFRDKVLMKDSLAAAGYPGLPQYRALSMDEPLQSVDWSGRIVVKSRWGLGSSQVWIVDDIAAANAAIADHGPRSGGLEVESFIEGDMYHCDSVVVDGQVVFAAVSQYVAAPGEYAAGRVAGSVLVHDGEIRAALLAENQRVLELLGLDAAVTHVEFFRTPDDRLVFCEAAARPGGGGISDIIERAYGVDIVRAAIAVQSGLVPVLEPRVPTDVVGIVGIYHSDTAVDQPCGDLVAELPGVVSYTFAPKEVPGAVRHCTDYAHKLILSTCDRAEFDEAVSRAVAAIRSR